MCDIVADLRAYADMPDLTHAATLTEAADNIERLRSALRNARGYIKDCDHEPALDEIDAALGVVHT